MPVMIIPNPTQGVNVLNFPSPQVVSGTVTVANFPSPSALPANAAQEMNGQLQKLTDFMESALVELRVISTSIAQLNDGSGIDPDDIRSDPLLASP
jgi:hypothetical protein